MNLARNMTVVPSELPDPPYPDDIRAKGMGLMVDQERIKQSTSWILCPVQLRPWMLMLWIESWSSAPAGSYEADDEVIAARIGMDLDQFQVARKHLMRGWYRASDGRLYHHHITTLVLTMTEVRKRDRERMAKHRADTLSRVTPPDESVTPPNTSVTPPESAAGSGSGSGTGSDTGNTKTARKRAVATDEVPRPDDVPEAVWRDWVALRHKKRAPVTETVLAGARQEAAKAGMPLHELLAIWCTRGSQGMSADWIKPHERRRSSQPAETPWAREARENVERMTGGLVSVKPQQPNKETIDGCVRQASVTALD